MLSSLIQYKNYLIAGSIAASALTTTAIVANKHDKVPVVEEKKVEFVFNDEFFGEPKPPIRIKELPFVAEKIEQEKPKPQIKYVEIPKKREIRSRGVFLNKNTISYDGNNGEDSFLLDNKKNNPSVIASKSYDLSRIITTNKVIPVVLETAINSEITTKGIVAQVESDVYGYHAKDVLLPRGSKIEGKFETIQSKHARRMQLSWYKITTPQGKIIELDSTSMDSHGSSGVTGDVDSRIVDRYGAALMFSGINTLANLSVDVESTRQLAVVESVTREIAPLTNQLVRERMDIKPIIKIRQGERINIKPHKNILFKASNGNSIKAIFIK